jgi:hypothetical protein
MRIGFPLSLQVLSAAVRSVLHMVHRGHASRDADPLCGLPARAVGGAHGGAGRLPAVTGKYKAGKPRDSSDVGTLSDEGKSQWVFLWMSTSCNEGSQNVDIGKTVQGQQSASCDLLGVTVSNLQVSLAFFHQVFVPCVGDPDLNLRSRFWTQPFSPGCDQLYSLKCHKFQPFSWSDLWHGCNPTFPQPKAVPIANPLPKYMRFVGRF